MLNPIIKKSYKKLAINREEICRYMKTDKNFEPECLGECLKNIDDKIDGKICYRIIDVSVEKDCLNFGFAKTYSQSLRKNLENCNRAILFVATIGFEIDRLINKFSKISPTKALCYQAIGTQQVEKLCDIFCAEMKEKYETLKNRFSPGYGDLPIEIQADIVKVLDCKRQIGVTLNDSLLAFPSKSVTAFVGIVENKNLKGKEE